MENTAVFAKESKNNQLPDGFQISLPETFFAGICVPVQNVKRSSRGILMKVYRGAIKSICHTEF